MKHIVKEGFNNIWSNPLSHFRPSIQNNLSWVLFILEKTLSILEWINKFTNEILLKPTKRRLWTERLSSSALFVGSRVLTRDLLSIMWSLCTFQTCLSTLVVTVDRSITQRTASTSTSLTITAIPTNRRIVRRDAPNIAELMFSFKRLMDNKYFNG